MKVRIENDGQPAYMTKVTNAETGEAIDGVVRVTVGFDVRNPIVHAVLVVMEPVVNIVADAEIRRVCPCCERPIEEEQAPESPFLGSEQ